MSEKVIIIRENLAESIAKDCFTFLMLTGLVFVGWLLESTALQWIGALMGFAAVCVKASGAQKRRTFDIAGARKLLDEMESAAS